MTPEVFSFTKVYQKDDPDPVPIIIDHRFRFNTITIQPLSAGYFTEANAVLDGVTGSVMFKASPPKCYIKFSIPDSTVDLSEPAFLNLSIPMERVYPTLVDVDGCTHVAITVTGFIA